MPNAWVSVDPPEPLTEWETLVIARLAHDAGRFAIDALRVTDRCGCGCSSVGFSDVQHYPAAEAEGSDADGMAIWVMLFADHGQTTLATLDVLRADGQPIQELPPVDALQVTKVSAWTGADS